jgi:hypothetical protein
LDGNKPNIVCCYNPEAKRGIDIAMRPWAGQPFVMGGSAASQWDYPGNMDPSLSLGILEK